MEYSARALFIAMCFIVSAWISPAYSANEALVETQFRGYWGEKRSELKGLNKGWRGYIFSDSNRDYCFVIRMEKDGSYIRFYTDGYAEKFSVWHPNMDEWDVDAAPRLTLTFDGNTSVLSKVDSWEIGEYSIQYSPKLFEIIQKSLALSIMQHGTGQFAFFDVAGSNQALKVLTECKFRVLR